MKASQKFIRILIPLLGLSLAGVECKSAVQAQKQPPACVVPPPAPTGGYCFAYGYGTPGCLDTAFGNGTGKVMAPPGMWIQGMTIANVGGVDKIVAVGASTDPCMRSISLDWILARYNLDGTLDTTFGAGGTVKGGYSGGQAEAYAVVVQPDGKLLVGGSTPSEKLTYVPAVARYLANGTLDTTFGTGGVVNVPYDRHGGWVASLALQPGGKIVATGCSAYPCRLTVFRLNANGTLDASFNGTGQYVYTAAGSVGRSIVVQTIGSQIGYVVAGNMVKSNGIASALLFRFTANGLPDTSFGSLHTGMVLTDFFGYYADFFGLVVDGSNRLLADGQVKASADNSSAQMAMARFNLDGSLDTSFNNSGIVSISPSTGIQIGTQAVALQSDGRILVTGSGQGMVTSRFTVDGLLDSSFGNSGLVNECFTSYCFAQDYALVTRSDGTVFVGGTTITTDGTNKYAYAALARYWWQ